MAARHNLAAPAFQKLQSLAGEWEGTDDHGMVVHTEFQSGVSRTLVMETLSASGMESMMTLYSLDGEGISLVHYCSSNNQPRMRALPDADPVKQLTFTFVGAGNLPTMETGHQHRLVLLFDDEDRITETWTWHQDGKEIDRVFHFSRKAPGETGTLPKSSKPHS